MSRSDVKDKLIIFHIIYILFQNKVRVRKPFFEKNGNVFYAIHLELFNNFLIHLRLWSIKIRSTDRRKHYFVKRDTIKHKLPLQKSKRKGNFEK